MHVQTLQMLSQVLSYNPAAGAAKILSGRTFTASTGKAPAAVSPLSMTQSVPSSTALATSVASARVGLGFLIIDSNICVAVMTGLPATEAAGEKGGNRVGQNQRCKRAGRWVHCCRRGGEAARKDGTCAAHAAVLRSHQPQLSHSRLLKESMHLSSCTFGSSSSGPGRSSLWESPCPDPHEQPSHRLHDTQHNTVRPAQGHIDECRRPFRSPCRHQLPHKVPLHLTTTLTQGNNLCLRCLPNKSPKENPDPKP